VPNSFANSNLLLIAFLNLSSKKFMKFFNCLLVSSFCFFLSQAQSTKTGVYVDKQGVLRWQKDKKEAAFFGVNYTTPFAFAYRAHKALNVDLEKAIRNDVYHFARLGFDAFRVHVWDTEISDTAGNLLQNDHLRLFDFLIAELKKRNIKTIITPIAFWGNGYPERDENTPGFSHKYGKGGATSNNTAIVVQENYLKQFFTHVNPYTKLSYRDDTDVIATEINNEPSHSGSKQSVTDYINRLAAAIRSTGWTKPVYYNISQSTYYAEAMAKANVDGLSFQWYPSGLVANTNIKGNYLPNVDKYTIPYDTIPGYRNKTLMVYEFDAADLLQSNMYPAIVRSFREAGFQWATQFAYDPMAIANVNTEYQTHYLNLAYTPSKAISALIASKAFHKLARKKNYGTYPADSLFDVFRVSYKESLSEMNTPQEFYYSNSTNTKPSDLNKLQHLAGVGTSTVVKYEGTGAYFLDKLDDGIWRLEIMPDAIHTRDPFERASPKKEVTRIQWRENNMQLMLPDLSSGFSIKGLNEGNNFSGTSTNNNFQILPGTYLLARRGKTFSTPGISLGPIGLNEFVAPPPTKKEIYVQHEPYREVSSGKSFTVVARVASVDTGRVSLQLSRLGGGGSRTIPMIRKDAAEYIAEVPAELVTPGVLNYRIIVQEANEFAVFPGNFKENPFAWDAYSNETWKTFVASENGKLEIFNPAIDHTARVYPGFKKGFQSSYITSEEPGRLVLKLAATELSGDHILGFQHFFGDKLKGRASELSAFKKLMIRGRTANPQPIKVKITLINADAVSLSTYVTLTNTMQDVEVLLNNLMPDSSLLLPRPYPGFLPLWFKASTSNVSFKLSATEKIEVLSGFDILPNDLNKPYSLEVTSIWFEK
jgi:hypothetical protein